jgi:hypothetical protein
MQFVVCMRASREWGKRLAVAMGAAGLALILGCGRERVDEFGAGLQSAKEPDAGLASRSEGGPISSGNAGAPGSDVPDAASPVSVMPAFTPTFPLDLARCGGTECDNDPSLPPAVGTAAALDCPGSPPIAVSMRWSSDSMPAECDGAPCSLRWFRIAVAVDGSLWVAASVHAGDRAVGVWLSHRDAEGRALSEHIVERDDSGAAVGYELAIVSDERGHAFLAVTKSVYANTFFFDPGTGVPIDPAQSAQSWLEEYDADGTRVGERIEFTSDATTGTPLLGMADSGAVAVSHGQKQGLTLLDGGSPRWVQSGLQDFGTHSLVADSAGRVTLVDARFEQFVEQYASDGKLLWRQRFENGLRAANLGSDRAGNLIRTGYTGTPGARPPESPLALWVHKLSPSGAPIWLMRVPVPALPGETDLLWRYGTERPEQRAVADDAGTLFIPGGTSTRMRIRTSNVYVVSADGSTCTFYELIEEQTGRVDMAHQLAVTGDGELFFSTGWSYGRFERAGW